MLKIYKMKGAFFTPFNPDFIPEDYQYLVANGIRVVADIKLADLIVFYNEKKLKNFMRFHPFKKNLVLWTNEPRFSSTSSSAYRPFWFSSKVNVMNVFTGDVLVSNVTYQASRFNGREKLRELTGIKPLNRKVVALMSYYNGGRNSAYYINGSNIDLVKLRSEIGLYGFQNACADIYGKDWPEGISLEDSRLGSWVHRKKELLSDYDFNLCFENTVFPKYITEKIWDSIECYCLPIYFGGKGSSIYDLFPKKSFIDYSDFKTPENLYTYIKTIEEEEYIQRLNSCIKVYNSFVKKPQSFWFDIKEEMLNNIINKFREISGKDFTIKPTLVE